MLKILTIKLLSANLNADEYKILAAVVIMMIAFIILVNLSSGCDKKEIKLDEVTNENDWIDWDCENKISK